MNTGDFWLIDVPGNVESWIQGAEASRWDHVQPVLTPTAVLEPSLPLLRVAPPPAPWRGAVLVEVPLSASERELVGAALAQEVGTPYSRSALVKVALCVVFPFLRPWLKPWELHGVVCSTALTWAYQQVGLYERLKLPADLAWDEVSPADLAHAWGVPE